VIDFDAAWKYSVSKKISQLTRVVFRLHTESVARAAFVTHIRRKCDDEIAAVVQRDSAAAQEAQQGATE
jgi:hypothetical protein